MTDTMQPLSGLRSPVGMHVQGTPGGHVARFEVRLDTNDAAVISSIIGDDEYRLRPLYPITGWVLDIGGHVGSVGVTIALDNPGARVVIVEPLADNAEIIRRNAALNGVADRVFVEEAGAAGPDDREVTITYGYRSATGVDARYLEQNRYVGNVYRLDAAGLDGEIVTVPAVSLDAILAKYAIDRVTLLKIDCETCEWQFLASPAIARVDRIIGEYHSEPMIGGLADLLSATHTVTRLRIDAPDFGIFEAVRR